MQKGEVRSVASRLARAVLPACAGTLVAASPALGHAADRGFVMLLPTGYYMVGGAVAVAVSLIVLGLLPPEPLSRFFGLSQRLVSLPVSVGLVPSALTLAVFLLLLHAGTEGSRDPLSNPLPLTVWTLFWVGLTLAHFLFGDIWAVINPWRVPAMLIGRLTGDAGLAGRAELPARLGYGPAIALFAAFAWFELVYPAPDDPGRLAWVAGGYFLGNLLAIRVFGYRVWMDRGECFSVFFGMVAGLGPLQCREDGDGRAGLSVVPPGAALVEAYPLPPSGAAFLLLALSTVSFDGLMRTFFWFGLNGLNPLEFEGRSSVVGINSAGLAAAFLLLGGAFLACLWLGDRLAGEGRGVTLAAGALVWSLIPISLAYHFSHYLTALLVNGQYALAALSDPYAAGWNLFGTAGMHVTAGIAVGAEATWVIWNLQAGAIIIGHVLAVVAAHAIAFRLYGTARRAALSQLPLGLLMVAYTVFGLWLMASPTGA